VDFDYLNYYGMTTSTSTSGDKVVSSGMSVGGASIVNENCLIYVQNKSLDK
jgi:hypothetical protein